MKRKMRIKRAWEGPILMRRICKSRTLSAFYFLCSFNYVCAFYIHRCCKYLIAFFVSSELFNRFLEERKANAPEEEEVYEYDEDGNILWSWKKVIDPLPSIDHSTVEYAPFNKDFYQEHEQIK